MALTYDAKAGLTVGAAVPCYRIYEHPDVIKHYPGLIDSASLVGGIQIQSRASLGGNLCNASPAGDTIPTLIALEGVCVIAGPKGTREVPVEDFCVAPGKTVLGRGELLVAIKFPAPKPNTGTAYLRFIPRNEMDIAVVGAGVSVTLDAGKSKCTAARVALAAVAPRPLLVPEAGAALVDGALNDTLIDKAADAARRAAKPISDMRGDADYRRHLAGVLVKRALAIAVERAKGAK
jgi:carbon-monoxide dehydrogenase medium subunit